MRVLVIGGTGAFGARLCDLLRRDGQDVTVAGRGLSGAAHRTAGIVQIAPKGGVAQVFEFLTFDRNGPLDAVADFDVIVDAAGPFHAYGDDPYRVAKAAIKARAHYFDLCDNAEFCQGISALDDVARAAGVCVYSGMSSVPAISSSVVEDLRGGQAPLVIETAILPGNKAPRGRSVVESILDQAGREYVEHDGGSPVSRRSWSQPRTYDLGGFHRQGWRIEVPDQRLFPAHFGCPSVGFRAGLELWLMRYGLAAFSGARARLGFGLRPWMVSVMMVGAKMLAPFGSNRGGMIVEVTVPQDAGFVQKRWIMRAGGGDGPYTPAIAVRAACRDLDALAVGAGPALAAVPLERIGACFEDLEIETEVTSTPLVPVFRRVLGATLDTLPQAVRATHDSVVAQTFKGRASVARGRGLQARIAAALFGFPPSTDDVDVEVVKSREDGHEVWMRRFGGRIFRSVLRPTSRGMSERFGIMNFDLDLQIRGGGLHFPVKGGRILGIPIPRFLLPPSEAVEAQIDGVFHFDVHLKAPTGATLVHYRGWLEESE